ncbi:MAG: ParB N-terminal domain-containing protein [Myxococcota bacterium]
MENAPPYRGIPMAPPRRKRRKPGSLGLFAAQTVEETPPPSLAPLQERVEQSGGAVLARYREPIGALWQLLAALPIEQIEASPFQRDLSDAHVTKLASVIERIGRYLDPIVVVPKAGTPEGFRSPNGHHRLAALRKLGARSIIAVVVLEQDLEYQILALNTEKAPGLKDRAAEAIRLARELGAAFDPKETEFESEFEDPAHLTLGLAYEARPRFAGSTYLPLLKKIDRFMDQPLSTSLLARETRSTQLLEVDDQVEALVQALRNRGFESPYLKTYVVARINPVRAKTTELEFEEAIQRMKEKAERFDPGKADPALL